MWLEPIWNVGREEMERSEQSGHGMSCMLDVQERVTWNRAEKSKCVGIKARGLHFGQSMVTLRGCRAYGYGRIGACVVVTRKRILIKLYVRIEWG